MSKDKKSSDKKSFIARKKDMIVAAFKKALKSGSSSKQLALSFCIGLYVAFSPFPGVHTVIMLTFNWLFRLNLPVLFIATSINNPWTMVPFYSFDYFFGYWLVHDFLGWQPKLVFSFARIFGSKGICLWSFLIGGNILGIVAGLICYPFVKIGFEKLASGKQA